jgi:ABC-type amino acid transport substrate-binding protein
MRYLLVFFLFIDFALQAQERPIKFSLATAELPPYVTLNKNKKIEGLFIDILNEVQQRTAIKIEIFVMPWGRAIAEVKKGNIDAIMPALWSKERANYLAYPSIPFYTFSQSVIIKRVEDDFEFSTLSNISPQKVIDI